MQIYKPIINYIAAAGLALAVALTPQSTIAKENPCETLETQLAQCQEEQRKKKLTPEEQCLEANMNAKSQCATNRDYAVAESRAELWDKATRTSEYEQFGQLSEMTDMVLDSGYHLCVLEADLNLVQCYQDAKRTPPEKKAKAVPNKVREKAETVPKTKSKGKKSLTCEERCEQEFSRKENSQCAKSKKEWESHLKMLERHAGTNGMGLVGMPRGYSNCINPLVRERRLCLDKCEAIIFR